MSAWARVGPQDQHDHLDGTGGTSVHPAPGLPGHPAGRAVLDLPPHHDLGGPGSARTGRRPGRDLERDAVPLAPVGPVPADRVPPPRARRDVEDGAPQGTGRAGLHHGAPPGAAGLPAEPDRHAVLVVEGGDREPPGHGSLPGHGVPTRRRGPLLPGHGPLRGAAGGGRGPPGAGQALRADDRGPLEAQAEDPRPAGGDRRRGLRADHARRAHPPGERGIVDLPARLRRRRRAGRSLPSGVGGGVDARSARAGA